MLYRSHKEISMKEIRLVVVVAIMTIVSLLTCTVDKDNEDIDVITMATPNGGNLNSAEDGPIRSALGQPSISLETFQLSISGLVDSSYTLSWEEIEELPAVFTDTILMYCVEGWEVWGNWKGVLISDLLEKAIVQSDGIYILFECLDGYKTALPISYLEKYNSILAYQVNSTPLQEHDGFPLRLICFGKYGYKWAKWVSKLEVMDDSQLGFWESFGYSDQADVPISRRQYYEGDNTVPLDYK